MSMPAIVLEDPDNTEIPDPTPTPTPPPVETPSVPVSDMEWDAAASAGGDALPDPTDTPGVVAGNGKFCEVCGTPLTGKQRRFCADHTRNKSTGTRTKRAGWTGASKVEANLTDMVETLAGGMLFFPENSPLHNDGATLYKFGPRVAHELVVLADDDPRMRKVLERLAAPGKYGPLILALGGLALGFASNHGLVPSVIASVMTEATEQMGGES